MILIPAAGRGQRFKDAGYEEPKHLIRLGGVPLIDRVIQNVQPLIPGSEVRVLTWDKVGETRGTAETIAKADAPLGEELVIANCDQLLKLPRFDDGWKRGDGVVFTFPSANPAHSYVTVNEIGQISAIVEKEAVSPHAVSGVYWFKYGGPITEACKIVCEGEGELYLSRALRIMLDSGYKLFACDAPTAILGTPEDFQRFSVAMEIAQC